MLFCSLPKEFKRLLWLEWHPCIDIKLWIRDASPSTTDADRAEHKRVHFRRLNSKNDKGRAQLCSRL